jgi:hypothetical protein
MSQLVQDKIATGEARIVKAPGVQKAPRHQVEVDQNFELPTALFGVTVACYLGFLAIMLATFAAPMLAIPMVIFAGFIVAGFGVPMIWTRLGNNKTKPKSFGAFRNEGVMTNTGRCAPRDVMIQMLILPVLIVCWGAAVAIIAAFVV